MARSAPKTSAATPKAASSSPAQTSWSAHRRADDMPPPPFMTRARLLGIARGNHKRAVAPPLPTPYSGHPGRAKRDPGSTAPGDGAWIPALRFAPAGMTGGGDEEDDRRDRRRHGRRRGGELPAARGPRRVPRRARQSRRGHLLRQRRLPQRLLGGADVDAGHDPQRAALAHRPDGPARHPLELSADARAVAHPLHRRGTPGEGARAGEGPARHPRPVARDAGAAPQGRRRRGPRQEGRPPLRLSLGGELAEGEPRLAAPARQRRHLGRVRRRRATPARADPVARLRQGRARRRERAHDEPAPARQQPRPELPAQRRPDRACACNRIRSRRRAPHGHPHRRRRRSGGRRSGRGRRLVEAARSGARRRPAARDRARVPPHDSRPRGGAAPAGCRRRRQVRRNPDGARHPHRRHGRARRPQGAAELGARPGAPAARAPDVSGPQGELSGGAHLDLDGPPPEPARLAAGDRPLAALAGRRLRLRSRPCRHGRRADDRQARGRAALGQDAERRPDPVQPGALRLGTPAAMRGFATPLPIDEALPDLAAALAALANAVLVAPPGAGKTTRVPLALPDEPWVEGRKLIVLEPRRLAARAAADRMAATLGEAVGETVGLRVRLGSKIGRRTRIEVVTDGVFPRMMLDDPAIEGVAAVLFGESHGRSLDADLGLARALDAQGGLREDLRLLVMSATLDGARVAGLLGDAPVIRSEGRAYPVETRHLGRDPNRRIDAEVVDAIARALRTESGSILAFLPGQGEIRRVETLLRARIADPAVDIAPLYGALDRAEQDLAVSAAPPGRRKIVLATSIAETSLTIEGVRVVIDSGLARVPVYEPDTGLTRLATVRVSRASADQRRGRAGRTEPGVCYRLWEEAATGALEPFGRPEILSADLAPLVLDCAAWGVADPRTLAFLDPPPAPAVKEARAMLAELGALDPDGRITDAGRRLRALPLPPRLAAMVLGAAADSAEAAGDRS